MITLKAGTQYIVKGEKDLETSFVLSGKGMANSKANNASGLILKDGEPTEQAIAVRSFESVSEELAARFIREAALCFDSVYGWSNPYECIAEPLFSGQCLIGPQTKAPVFIRRYIPGVSLAEYVEENGSLEEGEALSIISQIARGLVVAHGNNVIHKCLKPSNIILGNGNAKVFVTDFGSGCFLSRETLMRLTLEDELVYYLAPEQIKGAVGIDCTCDIFALGSILYWMITGKNLFTGSSLSRLFAAISKRPSQTEHSGISSYTRGLIGKMTALNRNDRYQSAGEFLSDLPLDVMPSNIHRLIDRQSFKCFQCGEVNGRGSRFCASCGRDFSARCSSCKNKIYVSGNFCRSCGEIITRPSSIPYIIGIRGGYSGHKIELSDQPVSFGRHKDNDISFAGIDKYVSRFQAKVMRLRNHYWIESGQTGQGVTTNGTFVNGRNIDGSGPLMLKQGDKIRMGDSFFRFVE